MTLYEKIANQISEMIHTGVLKQSEKLPSLRKASQIYGVSPATVQQAYFLLETQGVIYAKERSGFYINPAFKASDTTEAPITKFSQNAVDFVEDLLQNHSLSPQPYASLSETSSAIIARPIKEQDIEMSDFIFSILESHKDASHIPFGSAFPSPELFPINHLTDSMAKSQNKNAGPDLSFQNQRHCSTETAFTTQRCQMFANMILQNHSSHVLLGSISVSKKKKTVCHRGEHGKLLGPALWHPGAVR